MKLAVAIENSKIEQMKVAEHFGRCDAFKIFEIDDNKNIINEKFIDNPLSGHHGGACELPNHLKEYDINVVIAGGMGNKAISLFQQFNIEVITAPGLLVDEVTKKYLDGEVKGYQECLEHKDHNC